MGLNDNDTTLESGVTGGPDAPRLRTAEPEGPARAPRRRRRHRRS
ncbi:hypothetical protein [Curtobacterium sp. MCPF17_052]|nr:hypothetical protein [Curtobacterium sp. MCPF17_052]WIB12232.1 hypothetical protein DEJ36_16160 [Curtobacterium sp. MCPF17_052]